jgi:hypothetical protein
MKLAVFVDTKSKMMVLSIKQGLFMDTKGKMGALPRKRGVFMDRIEANKKRHPRKDVSVDTW